MSAVELAARDGDVVSGACIEQHPHKIQAEPQSLLKALVQVKSFTDRKSPIAIVHCVKLTQHGTMIDVEATDLQNYAKASVEGVGVHHGSWVLPLDELIGVLQSMKGYKWVDITQEDDKVRINSGTRTVLLSFFDAEDWPQSRLPNEFIPCLHVEGKLLADVLAWVVVAMEKNKAREPFCHMCLSVRGEVVRLVATDNYRMHYEVLPLSEYPSIPEGDYVINGDGVLGLIPQVKKQSGEWTIHYDASCEEYRALVFRSPDGNLHIRVGLIEGEYPDYRKLERDIVGGTMLTADAKELLAALKPCEKLLKGATSLVVLSFNPADDEPVLEMTCHAANGGESKVTLKVDLEREADTPAEPFRIGFDPKFLIQAVSVAKDTFNMYFIDPLKPTPYFADDPSRQGLIMPIRLLD